MKKLLSLSFALLALPSFAVMLHPHGHSLCLNGLESSYCKAGTKLYYAEIGCACLGPDQFLPPNICKRARIACDEGTQFQGVYQRDAHKHEIYAGCGCFSVSDGVGPRGIVVE